MRTIICVGTPTVAGAIAALLLRDEGWVVSAAEHMPVDRTPMWPEEYAIDIEGVFDKHWRSSHYTELRAKAVNCNLRPRMRRYRVKRGTCIDDISYAAYMRSRYKMRQRVVANRIACPAIMSDMIDGVSELSEWHRGHGRDLPWWVNA